MALLPKVATEKLEKVNTLTFATFLWKGFKKEENILQRWRVGEWRTDTVIGQMFKFHDQIEIEIFPSLTWRTWRAITLKLKSFHNSPLLAMSEISNIWPCTDSNQINAKHILLWVRKWMKFWQYSDFFSHSWLPQPQTGWWKEQSANIFCGASQCWQRPRKHPIFGKIWF